MGGLLVALKCFWKYFTASALGPTTINHWIKRGDPNPAQTLRRPCARSNHALNYLGCLYFALIASSIQYTHNQCFPQQNWTIVRLRTTPNSPVDLISWSKQSFSPPGFFSRSWLVGSDFDFILVSRSTICSCIWHIRPLNYLRLPGLIESFYLPLNLAFWGSFIHTWSQNDPYSKNRL